jgi:aspartyl-tRNA(Asn)/glutamyl-tRNA(Gln) amidotransferase subunit A
MSTSTPTRNGTFSRRDFLRTSAAATLIATAPTLLGRAARAGVVPDLTWTPAWQLRELIVQKEISPVVVIEHFLNRIEQLDPKLHAYITVDAEGARAAARAAEAAIGRGEQVGPLHGVPISIKDLVMTKGLRTTWGSEVYRDFIPEFDEIQVERLRAAGAIIIGKTNTAEFGTFPRTRTTLAGETVNPWDPTRISGASSGGAGASVALGMPGIAIGSDGGGSTRIPACLNGVFGFHPSAGRIPMREPHSVVMASTGPITIHVRDAAILMQVIAGPDPRDPSAIQAPAPDFLSGLDDGVEGARIAWTRNFSRIPIVDEVTLDATEKAAMRFVEAGASVDSPALEMPEETWGTFLVLNETSYRRGGQLLELDAEQRAKLTPPTAARLASLDEMLPIPPEQAMRALESRARLRSWADGIFDRYDFICSPTVGFPAPKIPEGWEQPYPDPFFARQISTPYTHIANILGLPAASVPCGFVNGMPIGLQIIGQRLHDAAVLRAAQSFSQLQPWMDIHPKIA